MIKIKKLIICIVLLIVLIISFLGGYFLGINKEDNTFEKFVLTKTEDYLYNVKEYKPEDIKSLKSTTNSKNTGISKYEVEVVFEDELESIYYYGFDKTGIELHQRGVSGKFQKHLEE